LTKDNIYGIVDLLIADLSARLQGRHIGIRVTDAAKDLIIESAYDPIYGARPLKRFLQSRVETLIARKMIAEDIAPESILAIDAQNGVLSVNTAD
jgi:ATP-dependent Clp protease ATP-binding subunit ClpB